MLYAMRNETGRVMKLPLWLGFALGLCGLAWRYESFGVCALMMTALYGYARRGQWQAVACLLVMLAYGYMESQVTHLTSDPALLLLCGAVFALPRERWLDE